MTDRWIVIPGWEKFQHYTDRNPPWIKVYTELNSNDDWLHLSLAERGTLVTVWVEYARALGRLSVQKAMTLCRPYARLSHLESLSEAGFIQIVASRPLALTRSRETEKILREEKAPSQKSGKPKTRKAKTQTWIDNTAHELGELTTDDLERVIEDESGITDPDVVADLVAYATERIKTL